MYKEIYDFEVEQAIKAGQFVRYIDKAQSIIKPVNEMTVDEFYKLLAEKAADKTNRYAFYVRIETEVDGDAQ